MNQRHLAAGGSAALRYASAAAGSRRPWRSVADEYELLIAHFPNLELLPITREILLDAAALRAIHRLRTPDAIQLATAMAAGATLAVTNDDAWHTLPGLTILKLADLPA